MSAPSHESLGVGFQIQLPLDQDKKEDIYLFQKFYLYSYRSVFSTLKDMHFPSLRYATEISKTCKNAVGSAIIDIHQPLKYYNAQWFMTSVL